MLEALAARIGRPVEELPAGVLGAPLESSHRAVGEAIDTFDPVRAGRLARRRGWLWTGAPLKAKQLQVSPGSAASRAHRVKIPQGWRCRIGPGAWRLAGVS